MKELFDHLSSRIDPLNRFIHAFAGRLDAPFFDRGELGFRFDNPGLTQFCLLRAVRIGSALNACIDLAKLGYTQEIGVLIRTVVECISHVNFVLVGILEQGEISAEAADFIKRYFDDSHRDASSLGGQIKLAQKRVHEVVGADLDAFKEAATNESRRTADLLSSIYVRFSYYVHARYPESIDLYGGSPGQFHLRGMSGTPKDRENYLILNSQITSASLCFKGIVQGLRLHEMLSGDPILLQWMSAQEI